MNDRFVPVGPWLEARLGKEDPEIEQVEGGEKPGSIRWLKRGETMGGAGEVQGKDNLATSIVKALAKNREEAKHCHDLAVSLSNVLLGTEPEPPPELKEGSENVAEGEPGLMRVVVNSTRITMAVIRDTVTILEKVLVDL